MSAENKTFMLQWHVTRACDKNCDICYMTAEERKQTNLDLNLEKSLSVIDDFDIFSRENGLIPRIAFTGGHPLYRKDFFKILEYAHNKGMISQILGNPTLLNKENLNKMHQLGVSRYQLSFDGLEDTHDSIRGRGSFEETSKAIPLLKDAGIEVVVMSTVTKQNQNDIIELPEFVINKGASKFDFSRLVPIGNGANMKDLVFNPQEYRSFLVNMYNKYNSLMNRGFSQKSFGTKDPLWNLLFYEKGELQINKENTLVLDGCSIGVSGFCMDSDGSLYGCRRLSEVADNIKNTTAREFFFYNAQIEKYRNINKIEGCGTCELKNYCRGCRAVAWAETGDYFARDPQCWKE